MWYLITFILGFIVAMALNFLVEFKVPGWIGKFVAKFSGVKPTCCK
jgi:hypothetical protein